MKVIKLIEFVRLKPSVNSNVNDEDKQDHHRRIGKSASYRCVSFNHGLYLLER